MVEENTYSNKAKNRAARPKLVYLWTVADVQKWFRRHCGDYSSLYSDIFTQHDITGRVLVRINETKLLRLGVHNPDHRMEIWREILKLKLKTDVLEIRDMQRKQIYD